MSGGSTDEPLLIPAEQQSLVHNEVRPSTHRQTATDQERAEMIAELKYGAESVLSLVKPVSFTMIVVIATIRSVAYFSTHNTQMAYAPMHESDDESAGDRFGGALINVLIILCVLITMTFLLVLLYKYRCYRAIHGWLLVSSVLLLFFFSGLYLFEVLDAHNLPLDWFSAAMLVWNFGCGGVMAIHWKGPLMIQQGYLVTISGLMALILIKNLPDWTTWMLLAMVAVYDLFAVLCPGGPLKMLVETAQERDEPLFPALIYSSTMIWMAVGMAGGSSGKYQKLGEEEVEEAEQESRDVDSFAPADHTTNNEAYVAMTSPVRDAQQQPEYDEEEEDAGGIKLGLGDFIFYSVLVGKAATTGDYGTIAACYVAIIIGLVCTLFILSVFQKALPALPISIAFGLVFYFATSAMIAPCFAQLALRQTFV
jgi:presenilin 1